MTTLENGAQAGRVLDTPEDPNFQASWPLLGNCVHEYEVGRLFRPTAGLFDYISAIDLFGMEPYNGP